MKKLLVLTVFVLFTEIVVSQTFEKGNLVELCVLDITLTTDSTYTQWKDIVLNKYIPGANKAYRGELKMFLFEGFQGQEGAEICLVMLYKSVETKEKYLLERGTKYFDHGVSAEIFRPLWRKGKRIHLLTEGEYSFLNKTSEKEHKEWLVQ